MVTLQDVCLPKFDKNRHIEQQCALIFDTKMCKYDIKLATNFVSKDGIKLAVGAHLDQGLYIRKAISYTSELW